MTRLLSRSLLICALLLSNAAQAADAPMSASSTASRWAWVGAEGGTYWYVPTAYLPAYRWNTGDPAAATQVSDQTVWHIERFENGYFFGPAVAQLDGGSAMCQYMNRLQFAARARPARDHRRYRRDERNARRLGVRDADGDRQRQPAGRALGLHDAMPRRPGLLERAAGHRHVGRSHAGAVRRRLKAAHRRDQSRSPASTSEASTDWMKGAFAAV